MNNVLVCVSPINNVTNCFAAGTNSEAPVMSFYRPRGSLARTLYEKQKADEYLSTFDKTQWYQCELQKLPESIASRFIQLEPDEDTLHFIRQSEEKSDWILTQIWHALAKAVLGWFMTQTSINGWLQRGSMFVLSFSQFVKLLGWEGNKLEESLLDLGAGDGEVTARLAKAYKRVYVTEVSNTMQNLLKNRGFEVLPIDNWHEDRKFETISCLNVLDRCDRPNELLNQIINSLKPNGKVLLALVLPFSPYVESGSKDHKPKEFLCIKGSSFEEQVESLVIDVFHPLGFELISWSRVPYLCEGDLNQSYYWLDDAVFVLKKGISKTHITCTHNTS